MPFLLAEILNFQGSIHRIGVGSFSYLLYMSAGGFSRVSAGCMNGLTLGRICTKMELYRGYAGL